MTDFLIVSAEALDNAESVKANSWQDAVKAYAQTHPVSPPRVACIAGSVYYARVETIPVVTVTVTPE